jgi:DNA helicase-2/ATP-dependent DNA helicase PcrA
LNETVLPSSKSLNTSEELEEERRLFYVGITRAQEYLLLLNAYSRNVFGQIVDQVPSRFLSELPSSLCLKMDIERMHSVEVSSFWQEWVNGGAVMESVMTFGSHNKSNKKHVRMDLVNGAKAHISALDATSGWKTGAFVKHAKFGQGVVLKVEKANDQDFYLTVAFKAGQKKLLSSYLKQV